MRKLNTKKSISLNQRGPTVSRYVYEGNSNDSVSRKTERTGLEDTSLLQKTESIEREI